MNVRRITILFLALIFIIAAILIFFQNKNKSSTPISLPTPGIEDRIENKFNGLVIPDDTEKIELKNVSGVEGMGIATKEGIYADLPDVKKGENYQVVIGNGKKTMVLGNLTKTKGGWILEYDLSRFEGYNQIAIVKDGQNLLEGTF